MAISHDCRLIETHDLRVRYGLAYPALDVNAAVAACRRAAELWLDAHGMDATVSPISRSDGMAGVTFDIHVGHGDIHADQRVPGVLDEWTWSARVGHWRDKFGALGRRRLSVRREDIDPKAGAPFLEADRIAARLEAFRARPDAPEGLGQVIRFPETVADRLAERQRVGSTANDYRALFPDGCCCRVGGPFVGICPIHGDIARPPSGGRVMPPLGSPELRAQIRAAIEADQATKLQKLQAGLITAEDYWTWARGEGQR